MVSKPAESIAVEANGSLFESLCGFLCVLSVSAVSFFRPIHRRVAEIAKSPQRLRVGHLRANKKIDTTNAH